MLPIRLPYIVLTELDDLKAYIEVKLGDVDVDSIETESELSKIFFKLELVTDEEDYKLAKLAYLISIGQNKELPGSTKKNPKYGAFDPDELMSIMRGINPKKSTLGKRIKHWLFGIGSSQDK